MKPTTYYTTLLSMTVALAMAGKAFAGQDTTAKPVLAVLFTTASAELPAKAAEMVASADAKNLKQTTIDVVKAAVGLNPAAAPAIVGSIAQSTPAMAATAAATAVTLVPNQLVAIARAAAAAAPTKAGSIVEAICRVLPVNYQKAADAVAEVVPGAGKEILAGIVAAIPELKDSVNQTLASYNGNIPSVSTVLTQVAQAESSSDTMAMSSGTTSMPRGPTVTGPQTPITGTPPVINPGSGGTVPNGDRGYAAP